MITAFFLPLLSRFAFAYFTFYYLDRASSESTNSKNPRVDFLSTVDVWVLVMQVGPTR